MNTNLDKAFQDHNHGHESPTMDVKILNLDPKTYPGGIAIWGALPAILNTSSCPDEDNGVHVHARMVVGGLKQIDETFDIVRVTLEDKSGESHLFDINGQDTANYNISTIFKKQLTYIQCPNCNNIHSDRGWYAVHYHTEHICENCFHSFKSDKPTISNPIMLLKEVCGDVLQDRPIIDPVERKINVKRNTFKGGMQIWGSNPAVLWTSPKYEEGGIHFHGFQKENMEPTVDETYGTLIIDNLLLDPEMVRHLMAQNGLTYLKPFLKSLVCTHCGGEHFDKFDLGVNPHQTHECEHCEQSFMSPNNEFCVSNPIISFVNQIKKL